MRTGKQDDIDMNQMVTEFQHALLISIIQTGGSGEYLLGLNVSRLCVSDI
jgi:hypothetical protein